MSSLVKTLIAEIAADPQALGELAAALGPLVTGAPAIEDGWLDSSQAAAYLGYGSTSPIKKHTAARTIPFAQERQAGKCWFKRSELDRWRQGGG